MGLLELIAAVILLIINSPRIENRQISVFMDLVFDSSGMEQSKRKRPVTNRITGDGNQDLKSKDSLDKF
ncbi:MAG: hypothetical protein M0P13_08920 [Fibrobacteraceae bacterium]|nr:hypothetical protein [Fibrobacteraceae bacterium]